MTQRSNSDVIRAEATQLLNGGLRALLEGFGEVHVVGSYALDLMAWRDLDIHVLRPAIDRSAHFALGDRLAELLRPRRMHFRDETIGGTPHLPRGLYWGIYLGDERAGAWKIDVWVTTPDDFEPTRRFAERIASRLTDENRRVILAIKEACWDHPGYRRQFTSADVYAAVLDRGVADVAGFWRDLQSR